MLPPVIIEHIRQREERARREVSRRQDAPRPLEAPQPVLDMPYYPVEQGGAPASEESERGVCIIDVLSQD